MDTSNAHVPIYMDYHATTPIDESVLDFYVRALRAPWGNPHGIGSHHNSAAAEALETARANVAALLGVQPREIVFTSGATEANNLAIAGAAGAVRRAGRSAILISGIEHKSVLEPAQRLASDAFRLRVVPVSADGIIDLDSLAVLLDESVGLVSVMAANNEIGTVQPIDQIARACHSNGALFHSDLSQAAGRIDIDASLLSFASVSSHKMHGPAGVGALYVSRKARRVIRPLIVGGGQEFGLRSGSVPVPLCAAFGEACRIANERLAGDQQYIGGLRDTLLAGLTALGGLHVHGSLSQRLPGNLNVRFEGIDSEALVIAVRDRLSISSGSACTASSLEPSHVLTAIGLSDEAAEGAVRIGIGRYTSENEVRDAISIISDAVFMLRDAQRRVA